jgi:HEPN domain-containing protein
MSNDPVLIADTRAWFSKARNDLQAAERLAGGQPPLLGSALFHCQQVVEKSLKAFLTWHDLRFRRTHDLNELGSAVSKIEGTLT